MNLTCPLGGDDSPSLHWAPPYATILHYVNTLLPYRPQEPHIPRRNPFRSEANMTIRFGWTRPQDGPERTDEDQVDDVSSPVSDHAAQAAPAPAGGFGAPGRLSGFDGPGFNGPGFNRLGVDASAPDAVVPDASNRAPMNQPSPEALEAIWNLHARVVETERRTHRRMGAAAARRTYHEALVEEANALADLGFESFGAFEERFGADAGAFAAIDAGTPDPPAPAFAGPEASAAPAPTPTPADDEPETAGETIGRIRVLLSELGIEPGADPLNAAKQFLDVVETETPESETEARPETEALAPPTPPTNLPLTDIAAPSDTLIPGAGIPSTGFPVAGVPRPEPSDAAEAVETLHEPAPGEPKPEVEEPEVEEPEVDEPAATAPEAEQPAAEEPAGGTDDSAHTEEPAAGPPVEAPAAAAVAAPAPVVDEEALELAHARAERWHAELEQVRTELAAASIAHGTAELDAGRARGELASIRNDLELAQVAARTADAEIAQRVFERDDAIARSEELVQQMAQLRDEADGLRSSTELQQRERDEITRRLDTAQEQIHELEARVAAADEARAAIEVELESARRGRRSWTRPAPSSRTGSHNWSRWSPIGPRARPSRKRASATCALVSRSSSRASPSATRRCRHTKSTSRARPAGPGSSNQPSRNGTPRCTNATPSWRIANETSRA